MINKDFSGSCSGSTLTIVTTYNDGTSNTSQSPQIDWIKSAILDSEKNLKIDYVNATDINVPLKTPNEITLETGKFYATYNTGAKVEIGTLGTATLDASAGEGTPDPNLSIGGLWFVTQEMGV